jgi:hypothetical protein
MSLLHGQKCLESIIRFQRHTPEAAIDLNSTFPSWVLQNPSLKFSFISFSGVHRGKFDLVSKVKFCFTFIIKTNLRS